MVVRPQPFDRVQLFLGAACCGLLLGGWTYYAVTGLRPSNHSIFSNYTSLVPWLFLGGCVAMGLLARDRIFRIAFLLKAADVVLSWTTALGGSTTSAWWGREVLESVFAILLLAGGACLVRSTGLRVLAIAVLLAAIPLRYFAIKQWDEATGRTTIMTQVGDGFHPPAGPTSLD